MEPGHSSRTDAAGVTHLIVPALLSAACAAPPAPAIPGGPPAAPAGRPWLTAACGGTCDETCDGACDLTAAYCGRVALLDRGTLFDWGGRAEPGAGGPPTDGPLVSVRPSFTDSTVTVGRGVAQLEFGYLYTGDDPGDGTGPVRRHNFGDGLFRLGVVADWLEVRAGGAALTESAAPAAGASRTTARGGGDLSLAAQIALTPPAGPLPKTAVIVGTSVPTGSGAFSAGRALPAAVLVYQWGLTDRLSLGGNTRVARRVAGPGPAAVAAFGGAAGPPTDYTELAQSAILSASLTDRVGLFGEYFTLLPTSGPAADEHYLDGGVTVLLTDDLQYDARVGAGLNGAADDFFAGTGLSIRFR